MTTGAIPAGKGQATIPMKIRDSLGMKPGDRTPWPRVCAHAALFAELGLS